MATQRDRNLKKPVVTETEVIERGQRVPAKSAEPLPFGRMNYILMAIGVGMIILGFFLMRGPFVDSKTFSIPLHVAPVLVVAGMIEIIYAIMYKPKTDNPTI